MPLSLFFIPAIHNNFKNWLTRIFLGAGFSVAANSAGVNFKLNKAAFYSKITGHVVQHQTII